MQNQGELCRFDLPRCAIAMYNSIHVSRYIIILLQNRRIYFALLMYVRYGMVWYGMTTY